MAYLEKSHRIVILDIIRGFALFGILLVNTPSLNTPAYMDTDDFAFKISPADHAVTKFIFNFAMESFYPIFAMLFGIGAAIFLSKEKTGISKLYLRRMIFLFFIGVLHTLLVWWGDILIIYASLGIFLLFFNKIKPKDMLKIIIIIFGIIYLIKIAQAIWPSSQQISQNLDMLLTYSQGSFYEISIQRMHDWLQVFFLNGGSLNSIVYFLNMFGIMLFGMWVYKQKILSILEENTKLLIFLTLVTAIINLLIEPINGFIRAILYVLILLLITRNKYVFLIFSPLAYSGRMSLTNYLGFNICLSFIFYGYGLGLYGSMGPASQMVIVFGLYFSFLILSSLWLKFFPYGPFEYVWRIVTYGNFLKTKKSTTSKALAEG